MRGRPQVIQTFEHAGFETTSRAVLANLMKSRTVTAIAHGSPEILTYKKGFCGELIKKESMSFAAA